MKRSPVAPAARHSARPLARHAARPAALALAALLAACSSIDGFFSSDKVDYRSGGAVKPKPLEVPPDLTQLARDSRYQPQSGVVSAAATPGAAAPAMAASGLATVAPLSRGGVRVERAGNTRWLVVPMTPEALWPVLKAFWTERGFTIASENAEAGVMETDWSENRAKLPQDPIRNTLGRLLGSLYDSGLRDLYRTRVERTATGSEVYISHRGMEEVSVGERNDGTTWRPRPSDPQLEAEFLSRLMARLGPQDEANVARAAAAVASAPEQPARARALGGTVAALEVDEPFDRAWRRVGLALDRSGFTVEDRDRAAGIYFVRYVDPKYAGKEEPGWWARLWGDTTPRGPERYRVVVKAADAKTIISVLAGNGGNDAGATGQRIVGRLVNDLR